MSEPGEAKSGDVEEAVRQLRHAASSAKCWACGCLHGTLKAIERAIPAGRQPGKLAEAIGAAKAKLVEARYDCLGCQECHPAAAMNALNIEGEACPAGPVELRAGWPPLAGDYAALRYQAPVAVCTLTDSGLSVAIAKAASPEIAIVGMMQTENLGIERVIHNVLANPNIRFLIVCGEDSRQAVGHLPGQSLLALAQSGVDAEGRIVAAKGRRPFLRNISSSAVEHFRQTVEVIDMIGENGTAAILAAARKIAVRNPGPAEPYSDARIVPTVRGSIPAKMTPDPAGYFVIYADRQKRRLNMEHYANEGVLDTVIEGRSAAEVYLPAIDKGLVSRLDHAAYLGRELARAERSLASGEPYVQDAAPERGTSEACSCQGESCIPGKKGTQMRKWIVLACVLGLVSVVAIVWAVQKWPAPRVGGPVATRPVVLGVDQYMRNVDRYPGLVTVEGIVSSVSPGENMLALIDRQEWEECQTVTCAKLTLPVRWTGGMPGVKTLVRAEGEARQIGGKLVFVAKSVRKAQPTTETATCDPYVE
ncbi:MAG: DUF4346 domain-containing protein [Planctomycetes bacterium]|nr:DUF4346 domain-containing protein [Planctomycetota bacterium]